MYGGWVLSDHSLLTATRKKIKRIKLFFLMAYNRPLSLTHQNPWLVHVFCSLRTILGLHVSSHDVLTSKLLKQAPKFLSSPGIRDACLFSTDDQSPR